MTRHNWKAEMKREQLAEKSKREKKRGEERKQVDKTDYIYIDRKFSRVYRERGAIHYS